MSQHLRIKRHNKFFTDREDRSIMRYHDSASLNRYLNPLVAGASSGVATIDWIEACEYCTDKTPLAMIIASDRREPEKRLRVATLLAEAANLPLFVVEYASTKDYRGNLDIARFYVRRVSPEPTKPWRMTPAEYAGFLLRLRRVHYETHHRTRLNELSAASEPGPYIRPNERITDPSILYSEWHRMKNIVRFMGGLRTPGALDTARSLMMVDLDTVETCPLCSQPMALMEYHRPSSRRPEMPKYAAVTRAVGLRAGLPTYSVMNMPTPDGTDITAFHVRTLGPRSPEEYVRMTPEEFAVFLLGFRETHYQEHHPESLHHVGVKREAPAPRFQRGYSCGSCRSRGRARGAARHATIEEVRECSRRAC